MKFLMSHPDYHNEILVMVILGNGSNGSWVAIDEKNCNEIVSGMYFGESQKELKSIVFYKLRKLVS